jgi:subtilisin family serine protease
MALFPRPPVRGALALALVASFLLPLLLAAGSSAASPPSVATPPEEATPAFKLSPSLQTLLLTPLDQPIRVLVEVRGQPILEAARQTLASRASLLAPLSLDLRAASQGDPEQAGPARQALRATLHAARVDAAAGAADALAVARTPVLSDLASRGYVPYYIGRMYNAFAVEVPPEEVWRLVARDDVVRASRDARLAGGLAVSAPSLGAPGWWLEGRTGDGWAVAVVDTGIADTHPALSVAQAKVFHRAARFDPFYGDRPDLPEDLQGHGTHIAGIVASRNATYRGLARDVDLINAKFGYRSLFGTASGYMSDAMEAMDWAVLEAGADVITFSFGVLEPADGESVFSRYLDALVDGMGVFVAVGAMNFGPDPGSVAIPADAYNVLSVGNMDDRETVGRGDDVLHFASGRGPTADGRLKPDLVAPGTNITSTNFAWSDGSPFVNQTGTSMATPHVAGAAALILNFLDNHTFPALIKAIMINAAADVEAAGPDPDSGWGYLDLAAARRQVDNAFVDAFAPGETVRLYAIDAPTGAVATLAWQRRVAPFGAGLLPLANLDLAALSPAGNRLLALSASPRDNVERIQIPPSDSPILLRVTRPPGSSSAAEPFALASSVPVRPVPLPAFAVDVVAPCVVPTDAPFPVEVVVRNEGTLTVEDVSVALAVPEDGLLFPTSVDLGVLAPRDTRRILGHGSLARAGVHTLSLTVDGRLVGQPYFVASRTVDVIAQSVLAPVLLDVGVVPRAPDLGDVVTVEGRVCSVRPLAGLEADLVLPEGMVRPLALGTDGTGQLQAQVVVEGAGLYVVDIRAEDEEGASAGATVAFVAADHRPPSVIGVRLLPEAQERGGVVALAVDAWDASGIARIDLALYDPTGRPIPVVVSSDPAGPFLSSPFRALLAGTYAYVVRAVDGGGNVAERTGTFLVTEGLPPVAVADASATTVPRDGSVVLDGSGSRDDVALVRARWLLVGPDEILSWEGLVAETPPLSPGTYRAWLFVWDAAGRSDAASLWVRVLPDPRPWWDAPLLLPLLFAATASAAAAFPLLRRRP